MTIKQAIERLNFMIQQHICYEEVVLEDDNEDAQEELHETEVELEALRMAVQALEEKPRWIPCSERLPEPRIDVWCNSDMGQMVGYYEENVETWYGRDYLELMVTAWMPLPEPYKERREECPSK